MPVADLNNPLVPGFDVVIDGRPIPAETEAHVVGLSVDDSVDVPSMFALELAGADDAGGELTWVDDPAFAVGKAIEVKMGYGDDLETLIKGEITALEPEFVTHRLPLLTVRGYDRRHRLQRGRRTRTFVQQKDSDIVAQIAREAGLMSEVQDSAVTHDYVVQANQTDFDFLRQRAALIQYEVGIDDKKVIFRPAPFDKGEAMTLTMDDHLLEFYPRLSAANSVSEVTVRWWSPKDKKEFEGKSQVGDELSTMSGKESGPKMSKAAFGDAPGTMSLHPVMTQAEADQVAKARFNVAALALTSGEGACLGRTDLRAGKVIRIDGVGRRFSGNYYVVSALHRYDPQRGYLTHFNVRRNAS